jgi:hypothetical protein
MNARSCIFVIVTSAIITLAAIPSRQVAAAPPSGQTPSAANSTLSLDRSTLPATETAHLTVTVKDANSKPLNAVQVSCTAPNLPDKVGYTNSSGVVTFSLSPPPGGPGTVTYMVTAGVQLGSVSVTFTAPAPTPTPSRQTPSAASSSLSLDRDMLPATDTAHLTVTVKDANGNPLNAVQVSCTAPNLADKAGYTNSSGVVIFSLSAPPGGQDQYGHEIPQPGTVRYTLTSGNIQLGSVYVNFTAPAPTPTPSRQSPSAASSSLSLDRDTLPDTETAHLTVTIRDAKGNPLNTVQVLCKAPNLPDKVGYTNPSGIVTFSLSAPPGGQDQYGHEIPQPATVRYTVTAGIELGSVSVTFTSAQNSPTPAPTYTPAPSPKPSASPMRTPAPAPSAAPAVIPLECSQLNSCWSATAVAYRGQIGKRLTVYCPAGAQPNYDNVYGTDIYSDDTEICTAAVHAGLIQWNGKVATTSATVTIEIRPSPQSYKASKRNGIQSNEFGPTEGAYVFIH